MYKRYFSSSDERILKEKANIKVTEVSTGVYYVEKDRVGIFGGRYINSDQLTKALNLVDIKLAVSGSSGTYSNFDMEDKL